MLHVARTALVCAGLAASLAACGTAGPRPSIELLPAQGLSGMVALSPGPDGTGPGRVLVVHDSKVSDAERMWARLGVIRTQGSAAEYSALDVDWSAHGPASDLEAVCLVPGTDDELLALESGYFRGMYGRLFHMRLEGPAGDPSARVIGATQLPLHVQELEGLACAAGAEVDEVLLVFGERDLKQDSSGRLHWTRTDLSALPDTLRLVPEDFPGAGSLDFTRVISDLYLDGQGRLWAAAAEDGGESGPFRSVVYLMGEVDGATTAPLKLLAKPVIVARVAHLKVEGLTGPVVSGSWFSVGTEDETLGAFWFPLRAPSIEIRHR